jgi:hypothetical protein
VAANESKDQLSLGADGQLPSVSLSSEHLAMFNRLGISRELLAAAGVHTATDQQARDKGFRLSSAPDLSGVVFPYRDPETGKRVTARLRRDHSDVDATGKPEGKYVSPFGDTRHLYFPPGAAPLLADVSVPVVIVEAEKSALALTSLAARVGRKILAIATGGCWGWRGKAGIEIEPDGGRHDARGPLPDFDRVKWPGRTVMIALDTNAKTNPQVRAARRALAEELATREASVKIADLPQLSDVNGPDDLIATSGDEAMLALLDSAQPYAETAEREAEAAVAALGANKDNDPLPVLDAIAGVVDPVRRTILIGKVVPFKIPGLTTKGVVQEVVEDKRKAIYAKKIDAVERVRRERLLRFDVNPEALIADLERFYASRRNLPADAAFIEALFAMNAHTYDVFDTTPYLLYDSATGGCGKTTTLERHELICARAYLGVDPSAAALYRKIDRDRPTYLLDEAKVLQIHGERSQELLALFDAGYKRGATVSRCEDHGEGLRDFNVYCPKVLARIGGFRGTLLDRGIVFHLDKDRSLRQKNRKARMKEASPLKEKLEAYALQYREQLEGLYEREPDDGYWPQISGREEEVWGPLLIHARASGAAVFATKSENRNHRGSHPRACPGGAGSLASPPEPYVHPEGDISVSRRERGVGRASGRAQE